MRVLTAVPTYPGGTVRPAMKLALVRALGGDNPLYLDQEPNGQAHHYDSLLAKLQAARDATLNGGFDALWLVEADVIVPPDALDKLVEVDADVVYGLYCGRDNGIWLCFPELTESGGASLSADPTSARESWGKIVSSHGLHTGCTLIRREVLEHIPFRCPVGRKRWAPDFYFSSDAREAGFRQASHLGVVCGHEVRPGVILWPDPNEDTLYRIGDNGMTRRPTSITTGPYIALKTLVTATGYIYPGQPVELSDKDTITGLLERQAIRRVEEPPAAASNEEK